MFDKAFYEVAKEQFVQKVISENDFLSCKEAVKNKEGMKRARRQMMSDPDMLGGFSDWNWEAIKQWFIDYFIPAMKIILPIIIMMLDENPTPEED
jgi:hypothetical protein